MSRRYSPTTAGDRPRGHRADELRRLRRRRPHRPHRQWDERRNTPHQRRKRGYGHRRVARTAGEEPRGQGSTSRSPCGRNGEWTRYATFPMYVSDAPLDDWGLTYRRIAPSYVNYNQMGIYQRCLANFDETPILENTADPGSCINCHTANRTDPAVHIPCARTARSDAHTAGRQTRMAQHRHRLHTRGMRLSLLAPDGKVCGFLHQRHTAGLPCHTRGAHRGARPEERPAGILPRYARTAALAAAPHRRLRDLSGVLARRQVALLLLGTLQENTRNTKEIRYNLCRIAFDAATGTFGNKVDTIFNAAAHGLSATLPRPSYDGRYIMFTTARYGCFPVWHEESDLWLLNLGTLEARPMTAVNSKRAESFHNWSRNSRWFVFTSRRGDGLYTNLYMASVGKDGKPTKPLPPAAASPVELLRQPAHIIQHARFHRRTRGIRGTHGGEGDTFGRAHRHKSEKISNKQKSTKRQYEENKIVSHHRNPLPLQHGAQAQDIRISSPGGKDHRRRQGDIEKLNHRHMEILRTGMRVRGDNFLSKAGAQAVTEKR